MPIRCAHLLTSGLRAQIASVMLAFMTGCGMVPDADPGVPGRMAAHHPLARGIAGAIVDPLLMEVGLRLREGCVRAFRHADADADGFVTLAEALAVGIHPTAFMKLDRDGDGRLALDELAPTSELDAFARWYVAAGQEFVAAFDRSGDGRLSWAEVAASTLHVTPAPSCGTPDPEILARRFAAEAGAGGSVDGSEAALVLSGLVAAGYRWTYTGGSIEARGAEWLKAARTGRS